MVDKAAGQGCGIDRRPTDLKVQQLYAGKPVPVEFDRARPEILSLAQRR
jgi:hypothetical protein